jgi:uncharacterized iron-regulated protein
LIQKVGAFSAALVLLVLGGGIANAQTELVVLGASGRVNMDAMLEALRKADVVFVGEQHDHARGHELELELLKELHARNPKTLLSLEMFERDVQPVVDEYVSGLITEQHFLQASRPWPAYKTDYRPMVEFCKEKQLPVVAANAPRRYVNIVSRRGQAGLADLPKSARSFLGRIPYSMDLPPGYDKMLGDLFDGAHGQAGQSSAPPPGMPPVENMKQAQALWDLTMADSIARAVKYHRGWKVMQVNGAGHSDQRYGIVDRLHQMAPRLKVAVVSICPDAAYPNPDTSKYAGQADYIIITAPDPKKQP